MKVIIKKTGEVKTVSDGHARNYLFPNKLAEVATEEAIKKAEKMMAEMKAQNAENAAAWEKMAAQVSASPVTVTVKANEDGTLFAKVPASAILTAVKNEQGIDLQEDWLTMPNDLKHTGEATVTVTFPGGKKATLNVHIKAE